MIGRYKDVSNASLNTAKGVWIAMEDYKEYRVVLTQTNVYHIEAPLRDMFVMSIGNVRAELKSTHPSEPPAVTLVRVSFTKILAWLLVYTLKEVVALMGRIGLKISVEPASAASAPSAKLPLNACLGKLAGVVALKLGVAELDAVLSANSSLL